MLRLALDLSQAARARLARPDESPTVTKGYGIGWGQSYGKR